MAMNSTTQGYLAAVAETSKTEVDSDFWEEQCEKLMSEGSLKSSP